MKFISKSEAPDMWKKHLKNISEIFIQNEVPINSTFNKITLYIAELQTFVLINIELIHININIRLKVYVMIIVISYLLQDVNI